MVWRETRYSSFTISLYRIEFYSITYCCLVDILYLPIGKNEYTMDEGIHFSWASHLPRPRLYRKCKMAFFGTIELFLTFVKYNYYNACPPPRLSQEVYIHYFTDWFRAHYFPTSCRQHQGAKETSNWHFFLSPEWQQILVNYWLCRKLPGLVPEVDPDP